MLQKISTIFISSAVILLLTGSYFHLENYCLIIDSNFVELFLKECYSLLTKVCTYGWNQAHWICSHRNSNPHNLLVEIVKIFCKVLTVSYRVKHASPYDLVNSLLDLYQDKCKYCIQLACNICIAYIITLHILSHLICYYIVKCKYCIHFAYKLNSIYV